MSARNKSQWAHKDRRARLNGFTTADGYMRIITRGIDQSIKIGSEITVTLRAIKGDRAKLGIVVPDGTEVRRVEQAIPTASAKIEGDRSEVHSDRPT